MTDLFPFLLENPELKGTFSVNFWYIGLCTSSPEKLLEMARK